MDAKIAGTTLDEANAAFRKHIDPKTLLIVKSGDFRAAGVFQLKTAGAFQRRCEPLGPRRFGCIPRPSPVISIGEL